MQNDVCATNFMQECFLHSLSFLAFLELLSKCASFILLCSKDILKSQK